MPIFFPYDEYLFNGSSIIGCVGLSVMIYLGVPEMSFAFYYN